MSFSMSNPNYTAKIINRTKTNLLDPIKDRKTSIKLRFYINYLSLRNKWYIVDILRKTIKSVIYDLITTPPPPPFHKA